ncbi:MAG: hypothetical protein QX196_10035 [Methylococcaceae bacterium]
MTSRLDALFTLGRLRQNWQMPIQPALEPSRMALNLEIQAKYHELLGLIDNTFPDSARLSERFAELTEQINQTFPKDATACAVDAKQKETLVEMLEQLEELLWALGLAQGNG